MSKRVSFLVHGTVQGVFFRDFTQKSATRNSLTGWVKNTPDGKVEGQAQGAEDGIQSFLKDINDGPRQAHVVKLEKSDMETMQGETSFEILP